MKSNITGSHHVDRLLALLCAVFTIATTNNVSGYTIDVFPPSIYNSNTAAMDAVLGISGGVVEDFEDTVLVPGLTESHPAGSFFNPSLNWITDTEWDGTNTLFNRPGTGVGIVFTYTPGTEVFGVGLSNDQNGTAGFDWPKFRINGGPLIDVRNDPDYAPSSDRNGYLLVQAAPNEPDITTVSFNVAPGDTLGFDHMVFANRIPEPASLGLMGLGIVSTGLLRLRKYSVL